CLAELGVFADGLARGEEGLRIAETVDHPASRMTAYAGVGYLSLRKGDVRQAISLLERGLGLCQEWQIAGWSPWITASLGAAYALVGRLAEALPLLEQAVEQGTAIRLMAYHALWVAFLGEGYLLADRLEDAGAGAERALHHARAHKERGWEAYALRLLG